MKTRGRIACVLLALLLCVPLAAEEYGHVSWADGYRGRSPEGRRELHVLTSHYGAAFDVERAAIVHLGAVDGTLDYDAAATAPVEVVRRLPNTALALRVIIGEQVYTCVEAATKLDDEAAYPIRLIDGGRFLNRFDLLGLVFKDAGGQALPATGRLEVAAWPERLCLTLELEATEALGAGTVSMALTAGDGKSTTSTEAFPSWTAATPRAVHLNWGAAEVARDPGRIQVRDALDGDALLPVDYSPTLGAYVVSLPARQWSMKDELDRLDHFAVHVTNDGAAAERVPLVFQFAGPFQGVTGLCPMLRDVAGEPTGLPVQISKNWHRRPERRLLYEGAWFHGVTEIPVPAGGAWNGEFAIAYARWGGVPSASHAQLALVGWGGNQRWDQAAIGSFGESICYDPDVGLNRSMIDDVRPLMLRSMNDGQWEWTHNVGGGDFLVYFDASGHKQYLSGVRTAYLSQGPSLTRVVYGGHSADGKIRARIEVSTPRCDDANRAYHRIRYDVDAPVAFSRLAFYQMGADGYNDHQFTRIVRGNAAGLQEEWDTERGGKRYLRDTAVGTGRAPWVALLGGVRSPNLTKGAWADRALVVRTWKARLGGVAVPEPSFGFYGTENGPPSANVELVPPTGCTGLVPGDFVEAEVEWLVLPQSAEDYYGPNSALRADLAAHGGTWRVVQRLAAGNDLQVTLTQGTLRRNLPIEIAVDAAEEAAAVVQGGVGYVPVRFCGLRSPKGHVLEVDGARLDQAVHGNDFWQAEQATDGSFTLTYNVAMDNAGAPHHLRLLGAVGNPTKEK